MAEARASRSVLADPWAGGVAGLFVVLGPLVAELVAGIVTNSASILIAALVLAIPVVVAVGFSVVQWQQVRSSGADPASWWHLLGIAAALFTWQVWPTSPGVLHGGGSSRDACIILGKSSPTAEVLARDTHAMDATNVD